MVKGEGYILDLGLMDYGEALGLQHHLWAKRVAEELPNILMILEHPHVITVGRRGDLSHLLVSFEVLRSLGISVYHVERGGDITYHGPGQLIVYPILDLKEYGYRVAKYIEELEEILIRVLKDFGVEGRRDSINRGVWVNGDKIASIGVAIKRRVSFHGIALNYSTDLRYFELIHPCGLEGRKMISLEKIIGKEISKDYLKERLIYHFKEILGGQWVKKKLEDIKCRNPLG
jgi:lipoate-protein ligase B